jgi:hypothetical protein
MTTEPAWQKILKGILSTDEDIRFSEEDTRKNKPYKWDRFTNKE